MVADDLLNDLNKSQKLVASITDGPLLVIAGAGSGKTRCITYRCGYLIATGKASQSELLVLTFTNKAARELNHRLKELFGLGNSNMWVGTFHSIFSKILRFESKNLPVNSNYVIYDEKDQKALVRQIYKTLNIDSKEFVPKAVRSIISRQKNNLITPDIFWDFNDHNYKNEKVFKIYQIYQKELLRRNALDFDDILEKTAYLFDENPKILQKWQNRFKYIMIDEYQDTNYAQFKIINFLAAKHQNICVVGDDDQAIYTWRGATIKNILNFEKDYKNAKIIKLEYNYRSPKNILDLANSLIVKNAERHYKELYTERTSEHKPKLLTLDNEEEEAKYVVEEIAELKKKCNWHDIAVLYRTNAQSRAMESALVKKEIPYQIFGGVNFFQRREIKDVLAYLRVISNPEDTESMNRVFKIQKGIGDKTASEITSQAEKSDVSVIDLIHSGKFDFLSSRAKKCLNACRETFLLIEDALKEKTIKETLSAIIDITGMGKTYNLKNGRRIAKSKLDDPELISRQENLVELMASANSFYDEFIDENDRKPDVSEYLNSATLQTDLDTQNKETEGVSMMTLHNAKGLEFKHVFIIGLEDGLLPHRRAVEEDGRIEEERRLLYVGITRAKDTLTMTNARWRRGFMGNDVTMPSRFIKDFDNEFLDVQRYDPYAYLKPKRTKKIMKTPRIKHILESEKHFKIGQKIRHAKFGIGMILNVDGQGKDARLSIMFDKGEIKKIVGSYVEII